MYAAILALSLYQATADEIETLNRDIAAAQERQDQDLQDYLERTIPENKICHIETRANTPPSVVCLVGYELI